MNMRALNSLDSSDIEALIELVRDYRDGVAGGDITGFHQPVVDEVAEANALLDKLAAILDR